VKPDVVSSGKADALGKPNTAEFCAGISHIESASEQGVCMDISIDQCGSLEKLKPAERNPQTVNPKSGPSSESCVPRGTKQASAADLMEGSFRDEANSRDDDVVLLAASDSLPISAHVCGRKTDGTKPVFKPAAKTLSSAGMDNARVGGLAGKNGLAVDKLSHKSEAPVSFDDRAKLSELQLKASASNNDEATTSGLAVNKLSLKSKVPTSFSDLAKAAAVPGNRASTNQINDSFAYRDQSAVLISDDDDDDDDDDNADKRKDKTEVSQPLSTATETFSSKQEVVLKAPQKQTLSETLPKTEVLQSSTASTETANSKQEVVSGAQQKQTSSETSLPMSLAHCEVSADQSHHPSTVITVRPSAKSTVEPGQSLWSGDDMEKALARRETLSKLLNHKKVPFWHCFFD